MENLLLWKGNLATTSSTLYSTLTQNEAVDPRSLEGHAHKQPKCWVKGAGRPGPRSFSAPSKAPTLCKTCPLVLGGRRLQLHKTEHSPSHTTTSTTGNSATSDAQPSQKPRWFTLNSVHSEQSWSARSKSGVWLWRRISPHGAAKSSSHLPTCRRLGCNWPRRRMGPYWPARYRRFAGSTLPAAARRAAPCRRPGYCRPQGWTSRTIDQTTME